MDLRKNKIGYNVERRYHYTGKLTFLLGILAFSPFYTVKFLLGV